MREDGPFVLILNGSPRAGGRCSRYIDEVLRPAWEKAALDGAPASGVAFPALDGDGRPVSRVAASGGEGPDSLRVPAASTSSTPVPPALQSRLRIWNVSEHPVEGCIGCEVCRRSFACFRRDDMDELIGLLSRCVSVEVVSPVYFSGPPAQLKAVLDRLQPLWERRLGPNGSKGPVEWKTPVRLHAIGTGGDPHGFEPLVTIVRSAFGSAGFRLVEVLDRIGWNQKEAR